MDWHRRRQRLVVPLVVAALCALTQFVGAQERWYQAYDAGVQAFGRQQWEVAEQKFKAALAANPRQGRRQLFYGTRRDDYLPEYYLAQIYLRSGRPREAAALFDKVQRDGLVTQKDREYAELSRMSRDAQAELTANAAPPPNAPVTSAPSPVPPPTAQNPVTQTNAPPANTGNASSLPNAGGGRTGPTNPDGAVGANFRDPQAVIQEIRAHLAAGRLPEARAALNSARGVIDQAQYNSLSQTLSIADGQRQLDAAIGRGDWVEAQRQLGRLASLDPRNARLSYYRGLLAKATAPAVPTVNVAELEAQGLRSFYRGDYASAIASLENPALQQSSRARSLFYLACSEVALALTQGGDTASRFAEARARFDQANGSGSAFAADRRYISPRILQKLQAGR